MGGDRDEAADVAKARSEPASTLGQVPRDSSYENSIEPAFEHCRLTTPPRGMDEHDGVAPSKVVEVRTEIGFGRGRVEMSLSFIE